MNLKLLSLLFLLLCFTYLPGQAAPSDPGTPEQTPLAGLEELNPLNEQVLTDLIIDLTPYKQEALNAYNAGDYYHAARCYLFLVRHDQENLGFLYNLACCYGLLGNAPLAAFFLDKAYLAGFHDLNHIANDPDFAKVRQSEVFQTTVERIKAKELANQQGLGAEEFFLTETLRPYRIHLPENFSRDRKYPLLVGLHGFGSNDTGFSNLWDYLETHDFIYATPQAPYPLAVGQELGFSWTILAELADKVADCSFKSTQTYIVELIKSLKKKYPVSDVFLMGFSQGAAFTVVTGINYPRLFDGLIVFGGWLIEGPEVVKNLSKARNLPVLVVHGTHDRIVEYPRGESLTKKLQDAGAAVEFRSFDGGHSIPPELFRDAVAWMSQQRGRP